MDRVFSFVLFVIGLIGLAVVFSAPGDQTAGAIIFGGMTGWGLGGLLFD